MAQQVVQQSLETWSARRRVDRCGLGTGIVRRVVWCANSGLWAVCNFRMLRVSNLREHRTLVVFDLKLMVGWGEHKVVFDESGFSAYNVDVDWGLNFLSVLATDIKGRFI